MVFASVREYFLLIFCCYSVAAKPEYCYMKDDHPYLYFGPKTSYEVVRAKEIVVPKDCQPTYIWAVIRHGTRFMTDDKWDLQRLTRLKNEIIQNHEIHKRGELCGLDIEALRNWNKNNSLPNTMDGELAPEGETEAANLAERLKAAFPDLLEEQSDKFLLKSTSKSRTQQTALAFTNAMFKTNFKSTEGNKITVDDDLLRIHDTMRFINTSKIYKQFIASPHMQEVIHNVSKRLGFNRDLPFDDVNAMHYCCSFEYAWMPKQKSAFCAAFTPDDHKILEYLADIELYYKLGYGYPVVSHFFCPIAEDLVTKLTDAAANLNKLNLGAIYFTHQETLTPTITKFGFYKDDEPLLVENFEKSMKSRAWKSTLLDPFLANLLAILYKCPSGYKVAFYINEKLIRLPGCDGTLCSIENVEKILKAKVTPENCTIDPTYLNSNFKNAEIKDSNLHSSIIDSIPIVNWALNVLNYLFLYILNIFV